MHHRRPHDPRQRRSATPAASSECSTRRTILELLDALVECRAIEARSAARFPPTLRPPARCQDQLNRNATRPRCEAPARDARAAPPGSTPTWSELERAVPRAASERQPCASQPEVNAWVVLDDDEPAIRVDFVWRDARLAVETDGHRSHRTKAAFEQDRRRDQRLTFAVRDTWCRRAVRGSCGGWRPGRVTWGQISRSPTQMTRTLAALMRD